MKLVMRDVVLSIAIALYVALFWLSIILMLLSPIPRLLNNKEHSVFTAMIGLLGAVFSPIALAATLIWIFDPPASRVLPMAFDALMHAPATLLNNTGFRSIEYNIVRYICLSPQQ